MVLDQVGLDRVLLVVLDLQRRRRVRPPDLRGIKDHLHHQQQQGLQLNHSLVPVLSVARPVIALPTVARRSDRAGHLEL